MSTLGEINIRLSEELGDSEINNKTVGQRNRAINDALFQIYQYRNWRELYVNETIQFVDQIAHLPVNLDKPSAIWYGKDSKYYWHWKAVSQTDFLNDPPYTFTITEENGIQVLKISQEGEPNRGFDANNLVFDTEIGINDDVTRQEVGQTFTSTTETLEGALANLSTVGSPTGTLTYSLFATVGGLPTGTAIATGTLNIREISSTKEYFWVKFDNPATVVNGDTYALTITPSYATDPVNYVQWSASTTDQIPGSQILFDGVWNIGAGDQAFAVVTDYYQIQYVKKFIPLTQSTEDTGLPERFDQAIAKMAAGIIENTKSQYDEARLKFYGLGNEDDPDQNSAFGLLNLIWQQTRFNSTRPSRRMTTVYDKYDQYYNYDYRFPYYSNF